tara:strand:- start:274 stop:825 length:552 start_codon:yes stop_codon:yes gene_type:complete
MKKLLVLLLLPLFSFGQIIVNKEVTEETRLYNDEDDGLLKPQVKTITKKFNITEIQDEYIEIKLGKRYHLLSTSKHKNIKISAHWKKKNWNVYDGDELIPMQAEIDILNFFSKYGFEYFKQNTKSSIRSRSYVPPTNYSSTSFTSNLGSSSITTTSTRANPSFPIFSSSSKSSTSITFKNNNN